MVWVYPWGNVRDVISESDRYAKYFMMLIFYVNEIKNLKVGALLTSYVRRHIQISLKVYYSFY